MKRGDLRQVFLLAAIITLVGCQTPFLVFPGEGLTGDEKTAEDFSFAADYRLLQLEVNPEAPYSVILRTTVINQALYIDAAPARSWGRQLAANPNVRVKLGEALYRAVATVETDPDITRRFREGRTVYRLMPVRAD